MAPEQTRKAIADLMAEVGSKHHEAFLATDGEDPEWPIWYADYLREPLGRLLKTEFTRSRLIYCVMNAEFEREARAPEAEWPPYYAAHFMERFAPAETPAKDKLALYYFPGCPFCRLVERAIDRLGIEVELRDIHADPKHRDDLIAARERSTVPVLRITAEGGSERWMPESRDIVRYLETMYAKAA